MNKILALPFFAKAVITLLCGGALSYTQAPHHLWFLIFPCFSFFYILYANQVKKRTVFLLSFLFAFGYFVTSLSWIGNALLVEGNDYKWAWPLAVVALPIGLSLFSSLLLTLAHSFTNKQTLNGFFAFTIALGLAEFVRGYAFTGFPWNLFGYTWLELPIAQIVSVIGPFFLTWLTILWGGCFGLFAFDKNKALKASILSIVIFAVIFSFGMLKLKSNPTSFDETTRFSIVQPNIAQVDKWDPKSRNVNFLKHIDLSTFDKKVEQNIIIWPETSVPPSLIMSDGVKPHFDKITDSNTLLLTGALAALENEETQKQEYHNGLFLVQGTNDPIKLYSKSHLVPFGEYIPFQQLIPLAPIAHFTGLAKGSGTQTIELSDPPSFSPQICYEIIFPSAMTHTDDYRPDYILTITNDAWYGDSAGPRQHFAQARFRAIEQGLPVIRSANTGISGVIDPYGRIIEALPLTAGDITGATINTYLPVKAEPTIYSQYKDVLFLIFITLSVAWVASIRKKLKTPRK